MSERSERFRVGEEVWIKVKLLNYDGDDGIWMAQYENAYTGAQHDVFIYETDMSEKAL